MIDRDRVFVSLDSDQLTEALDLQRDMADRWYVLEAAARLLLDFPTGEMLQVAMDATGNDFEKVGDVLEAVRQVMFQGDA